MRFHTHNRTPKVETKKSVKITLSISIGLIVSLFLFIAIACSIYENSIFPAVITLVSLLVCAILFAVILRDMDNAFIEIVGDAISVTDYFFGIKKVKVFTLNEIKTAEILVGSSMCVRGYRNRIAGCSYIVFRDNNGKYMFKVICAPETKQFFSKYLN